MCFTSSMYVQCVALNNVLYVALLLVWLSPLYCVFFCEESFSVHLIWPIAQWHSVLILFCVCHVVHDQLKGKRFRNKLVLCKSASFIFCTYFETVFMCLCGLFSYFDWGTIFFYQSYRCFALLSSLKVYTVIWWA